MISRNVFTFFVTGLMVSNGCLLAQTNKPVNNAQIPSPTAQLHSSPAAYSVGTQVNYVRTKQALEPFTGLSEFENSAFNGYATPTNPNKVTEATQFLDGLGRPLQTVMRLNSTGPYFTKDMVSPVEYDAFGREVYKYLPFQSYNTNGQFNTDPFTDQKNFLQGQLPGEQVFYSKTEYEASPLNRVVKTMAPGNSWAGSDRGVTIQYLVNTTADEVQNWTITNNPLTYINDDNINIPSIGLAYQASKLFKTVTKDERNNAVVEYKDQEGQVILKKVQVGAVAGDYSGYEGFLCTYYLYDNFNQLRFVIPPKAVEAIRSNWILTAGIVSELCFRYEYDQRKRMIAKKVPGAGWVYMVYDKRDRLTYIQDANMRTRTQWMATLYDALNRVVMTGMISFTGNREDLQDYVTVNSGTNVISGITVHQPLPGKLYVNNRQTEISEYKASESITFSSDFTTEETAEFTTIIEETGGADETIEYHENILPPGNNFIALTINYYDNYEWLDGNLQAFDNTNNAAVNSNQPGRYLDPIPGSNTRNTTGAATGTKVRVLEDPSDLAAGPFLGSVLYYDHQLRVIQAQTENYKGGLDISSNRYDFKGLLHINYLVHANPAGLTQPIRIKTAMVYDDYDRLLTVKKTINDNGQEKTIATNQYNALGQLESKGLGLRPTTGFLQISKYDYNVRGWLTAMNGDYVENSNGMGGVAWFGQKLSYDFGFDHNQFNGNIAGAKWKSRGDEEERAYGFGYDQVNRLLYGDFNQKFGSNWAKNDPSSPNYQIDFSLHMGDGVNASSAYDENGNIKAMKQWGLKLTTSDVIDDLTYSYQHNSSSYTNKLLNVKDLANDATTVLGDFRTSALHPVQVKDGNTVDYTYDANGNLLKDLNKDIGSSGSDGIEYNHLNLPYKITVNNSTGRKGTITYIYDAMGVKLQKLVEEDPSAANQGHQLNTLTDYIGTFVYEKDLLQFMGHEEGRIRRVNKPVGNEPYQYMYDYFLKDHLGNVRMVITEEQQTDIYPVVSLESQAAVNFENKYYNINSANVVPATDALGIPSYKNNNGISANNPAVEAGDDSEKLYKLNGTTSKMGLGITLKVMAGDEVSIFGKSYWKLPAGSAMPAPPQNGISILDLLTDFIGSGVPGGGKAGVSGGQLNSITEIISGIGGLLGQEEQTSQTPKAYINWILFDENFRPVISSNHNNSGFDAVGAAGLLKSHTRNTGQIKKSGYLYIYCSNESELNVFFDNLQVVHVRGGLLEETHYYPFGLTMKGISSKAFKNNSAENKRAFNGNELQNEEFSDQNGLNLIDFNARTYDYQIGRFIQPDPLSDISLAWSPYVFGSNNPINRNDPSGLKDTVVNGQVVQRDKDLAPFVITGKRKKTQNSDQSILGRFWRRYTSHYLKVPTQVSNLYELGANSMLRRDMIWLTGGLLERVKSDPAMVRHQQSIVAYIKSHPQYGKLSFVFSNTGESVEFGGKRASGEDWFGVSSENPLVHLETWQVFFDPLTWTLRHANIQTDAVVKEDGTIVMTHYISDKLDLRPDEGHTEAYKKVTSVLGPIYHDVFRGTDNLQIRGSWSTTIK